MKPICVSCNVRDDENHRLYECPKWQKDDSEIPNEIKFDEVYNSDIETIRPVIARIENIWNTKSAHGTMRKD